MPATPATDTAPAAPPSLSAALRARTAAAHADAERSPFLTALAQGRVAGSGLAALLGRLAVVYDALEQTGRTWARDAVVGPFLLPGLERGARLAEDLERLGAAPVPSPAATAYAARLREAGRTRDGYLAHHYTRCLGDLSGGQVLGAAVRGAGLPSAFFTFEELRPGEAARRYRALLDDARVDRDALVAEALVAYRLNVALTAELDADAPRWAAS